MSAFWHKADMPIAPIDVCFRGNSGRCGQAGTKLPALLRARRRLGLLLLEYAQSKNHVGLGHPRYDSGAFYFLQFGMQFRNRHIIRKPVADPNGRNVNAAVLAVAIRGIFQHVSSYVLRENRQQQLCRRRRELPGTPSLASCGRSSSFELAATDLPLGSGSKSSPGRTECFGPAILCGAAGLVSSMSDVLPRDNWIASL